MGVQELVQQQRGEGRKLTPLFELQNNPFIMKNMEVPQTKTEFPHDPSVSLLGLCLEESFILLHRYLHIHFYYGTVH